MLLSPFLVPDVLLSTLNHLSLSVFHAHTKKKRMAPRIKYYVAILIILKNVLLLYMLRDISGGPTQH
jgi:hypothetical protein